MASPRRGDGLHRSLLLLTGLVLLVGGVAGLLVGAGAIGHQIRHKPVFDNFIAAYIGRHGQWLWPLIALAVVVLGFLALRWIGVQFHTSTTRELDLPAERGGGRTLVSPSALTSALTGEIESYHGVTSAHARWLGQPRDAGLALSVTHARDVDLPALLQRLEADALVHLRTALDRPDLPVTLDLKAK